MMRSRLATLSLTLAILPLFILPLIALFRLPLSSAIIVLSAVVAFIATAILGITALVRISRSKVKIKGKGMAIVGIVLGAVFLILFVLLPRLAIRRVEVWKKITTATESELRSIQSALEMYYIKNDKYPNTDEGIRKLVEEKYLDEGALKDGYKRPYNYESIPVVDIDSQDYYVSSSGPDKIKGTEDDIQAPIGDHSFPASDKE